MKTEVNNKNNKNGERTYETIFERIAFVQASILLDESRWSPCIYSYLKVTKRFFVCVCLFVWLGCFVSPWWPRFFYTRFFAWFLNEFLSGCFLLHAPVWTHSWRGKPITPFWWSDTYVYTLTTRQWSNLLSGGRPEGLDGNCANVEAADRWYYCCSPLILVD